MHAKRRRALQLDLRWTSAASITAPEARRAPKSNTTRRGRGCPTRPPHGGCQAAPPAPAVPAAAAVGVAGRVDAQCGAAVARSVGTVNSQSPASVPTAPAHITSHSRVHASGSDGRCRSPGSTAGPSWQGAPLAGGDAAHELGPDTAGGRQSCLAGAQKLTLTSVPSDRCTWSASAAYSALRLSTRAPLESSGDWPQLAPAAGPRRGGGGGRRRLG